VNQVKTWVAGRGGAMPERSGPFWDGINGRAPIPPAAATLGFEFIDADVDPGGGAPRRRWGGHRHRHRDRAGDPLGQAPAAA
jgi:hypothetical protein